MPLRSEVLTKRWSTANLPILPFLAPRVFQPWPSSRGRSRRTHSSAEASQPKPKIVVSDYDSVPVLGREGQEEGLPVVVGGEGEAARNHRTRSLKDNTRGFQSSKSVHSNNVLQAGGNGPVVWKPVATKPLRDIKHLSAGFQGQNDKEEELLHAHDGTTTAIVGNESAVWDTAKPSRAVGHISAGFLQQDGHEDGFIHAYDDTMETNTRTVSWRHVGVSAGDDYDPSDHNILQDNIRDETLDWKSDKEHQLNSGDLSKHSTTSTEGTDGSHLMRPPPKTPRETRRFERDSYMYWRNVYNDLKHPTRSDAERARQKNRLRKDLTPYPFDRQRVDYLYQKDLDELWHDLIRLNTMESEVWWNELPPRIRLRLWPGLMLMALRQSPSEALKLLEITYTGVQPPAYAISDSLDYLVEHYLLKKDEPNHMDDIKDVNKTAIALDLQKTMIRWLDLEYGVRVLQKTIWTLVTNLDDDQVRTFYGDLRRLSHHFFPNTLIHFASRFAKTNDSDAIELSFDILKDLHGRIDFDHPAVMSLCTTILHRSHQAPNTKSTVAEKFQVMIGLGMKVNIIIYNVLINNAIRSGDSETAWSIHEMMVENEIEPDEYTYSILLNDAKWRMDSVAIRAVMGHIQEKKIAGPYITTDLIHLIYLLHHNFAPISEEEEEDSIFVKRSRCKDGFEKMLGKYREQFSSRALQSLIPNFSKRFTHVNDFVYSNPLPDPPAHTLVVMMTGLLQSLDSTATKDQYNHFLYLINQKNRFALLLASDSHIWNVFLMALGRFHDRLSDCPKVIKTMMSLRDDSKEGLVRYSPRRDQVSQIQLSAEPDIYTWSILVHIFTKHKQHRAAEKVITAMQGRGTTPNEVTWTTLAYSYGRSQDVEKMADTIHRMESTGVPVGERMVDAMTGIQDREGLMKALKKRKAYDLAAGADL